MHTLGRSDRVGVGSLVERAHLVGPHSGGVDDAPRRHMDEFAVGGDRGAVGATVGIGGDVDDAAAIHDHGAALRRGAGDGEGESSVVGAGVVVEVAGAQLVEMGGGEVACGLLAGHPLVEFADAPPAGQVVHPHGRAERLGDLLRDDTVLREDRDHEWQHLHEVRRIAHQPTSFTQGLVDQADIAVLQVAQATVDHLRTLRRRATGEVVTLDECGAQAPCGRVERNTDARDPAPDDEHVERFTGRPIGRLTGGPQGVEHGAPLEGSHRRGHRANATRSAARTGPEVSICTNSERGTDAHTMVAGNPQHQGDNPWLTSTAPRPTRT